MALSAEHEERDVGGFRAFWWVILGAEQWLQITELRADVAQQVGLGLREASRTEAISLAGRLRLEPFAVPRCPSGPSLSSV